MISLYMSMLKDNNQKKDFEKLYLLYKQDMYSVAYKILNNVSDAEDAVHQAFLRIANNFHKISEVDCPKTKAYSVIIVKNTAIDIYNHNKKQSNKIISMDNFSNDFIVDDSLFQEINYNILVQKILSLPEKYKDVLYLTYVIGYTTKEVSNLLNISQDSVYKRIQRAKSLLYKNIKEQSYE